MHLNGSSKYWEATNEGLLIGNRDKLNDYLLSLKLENKAESTIIKYRRILEQFLNECSISVEKIIAEDVRTWLINFSEGKSERTVNLYVSALSSFFTFCLDEEFMETTVIKRRWKPKIPHSLPKYLDEHEYARVKRIAEQLSLRDRALVLLLFSTGCRVSEVISLDIQDINLQKRTITVMGKGKKIRNVYFSEECSLALSDYIQTRSTNPEDHLFNNKFGNRLQGYGIRQVLKKVGKVADLKQSFHPHVCRHTFATNMLARGADLEFIADVMGHSDLNTTRIYAQIPTDEMKLKYQNIMG